MKENKTVELKERLTKTFVKTVSAFANYGGGKVIFGINDNGETVGIANPVAACLDIENIIHDNIKPNPSYSLSVDNKTNVITLTIEEGFYKPYLYRGKAYKRNDTSSVEVDQVELKRLILLGENLYFDQLTAKEESLSFHYLFDKLKKVLHIEGETKDILRTLELYNNQNRYNNAALLLADKNDFPGIDVIRRGSNIHEILYRETICGVSILEQLDRVEAIFDTFYRSEKIQGMERKEEYAIPKEAFREVIANALVHRTWDVEGHIRIVMDAEQIEIYSPGGLSTGLSEEEYLNGYISNVRNPILATIFFRLKIIEMFGTRIRRIKAVYQTMPHKPIFKVSENSVVTILPTIHKKLKLTIDEQVIIEALSDGLYVSSSELVHKTGFSKDKIVRLVNNLVDKNYVGKTGAGRATKYHAL